MARKAGEVDSNLQQFQKYMTARFDEKQKVKVQEKLDRCNKEKSFEFCDLLMKHTAKKEDVIVKLIDLLLLPHATASKLLAEKEQSSNGEKHKNSGKKSTTSGATPLKDSSKKQKMKKNKGTPEMEDSGEDEEEEENSEDENVSDGSDKSEREERVSEPESGEDSKKRKRGSGKPSSKKESAPKTKIKKEATANKSPQKKSPSESSTSHSKSKDQSETTPGIFSRENSNHLVDKKPSTLKKSASEEKTGKKVAEEVKPKEKKQELSDDEIRVAVRETVEELDVYSVGFTEIYNLVNKRLNTEVSLVTMSKLLNEELLLLADEEDY